MKLVTKKEDCIIDVNFKNTLVNYYRTIFKIEENYNHYDKHNYKNAEREFVKYALANRIII